MGGELIALCELYKKSVGKRELERRIFDFFNDRHPDRLDYNLLVETLRAQNVYDLMHKAQNVYFGVLVSDFLESAMQSGVQNVLSKYVSLNAICSTSDNSKLYGHYIKTTLSLAGDDFLLGEVRFVNDYVEKALVAAGWEYKKSLYGSVINEVVKLSTHKTKSAVIVISNEEDSHFLKYLSELHAQTSIADSKIIFVSNCFSNQTENVLKYVDTFIQLSDNYGDCLSRNIGSLFSNSEIVVFVDSDGFPDKGFLQAHHSIHSDQNILSLRGCCLPITNGDLPAHYWLGMHERMSPPILEGNCSFKLDSFYKIGGWGDYLFLGHGGYEICYRMLKSFSRPEQHIYSPKPILYHDWEKSGNLLESKQLRHHALWHLLRRKYSDFHKLQSFFDF